MCSSHLSAAKSDARSWKPPRAAGGQVNWFNDFGKKLLTNVKICIPCDSAILPLGVHTQRTSSNESKMICTKISRIYDDSKSHMFIESRERVNMSNM